MNNLPRSKSMRIRSMDVMRGMTLFLMLFVNDLYVDGVPQFLVHSEASVDAMGLADWVFPGFLFMVGMSVPYAMQAREKKGDTFGSLLGHVIIRSLSLLLIGVLILNGSQGDVQYIGFSKLIWLILIYICVFLVWNNYPKDQNRGMMYKVFRCIGILGICYLAYIFKDSQGNWLKTSWWGILGLIGWGYFASAVIYLISKGKMIPIGLAVLFFLLLNICSSAGISSLVISKMSFLSVLLSGNIPLIVCSGMFIGVWLQKQTHAKLLLKQLLLVAILCLATGFILRHWFILSKIYGTPSWALVCNGISLLFFCLMYYLVDVLKLEKGFSLFEQAGRNSLTTYLAPDIIYYLLWSMPFSVQIYKQPDHMILALMGSLLWAFVMLYLAIGLKKLNIHLKL